MTAAVLAGLSTVLAPPHRARASTLNCATATNIGVPVAECQALLALYDATNGPGWADNLNWNTDTAVGTWYGVGTTGGMLQKSTCSATC